MYKIVNNNIYIARGETAAYDVRVIDKNTGSPFILPKAIDVDNDLTDTTNVNKFIAAFSVRSSDYVKDEYAIKKYIWLCGFDSDLSDKPEQFKCNDIILLDTTKIYDYDGTQEAWSNTYDFIDASGNAQPNDIKALFRLKLSDGTFEYKANIPTLNDFGEHEPNWVDYSFPIKFPFFYKDTAKLSPKSYKYALTIYGGNNLEIVDGKLNENTIDYKKPLVDAQFIVEADINE